MFSFHKPKIYRSISGCCICKAKSSSSRFTDSKKYESEFEKCFCITEKRSGEICNACVLLVKRWKKLPPGTSRNWRHVVDARAGPGTKSLKFTSNKLNNNSTTSIAQSGSHSHKKHQKPKKIKSSINNLSNLPNDDGYVESVESRTSTPTPSDSSDLEEELEEIDEERDEYLSDFENDRDAPATKKRLRTRHNSKNANKSTNKSPLTKRNKTANAVSKISSFLDMSFWRREKICCGIIFKGPDNEVLIYPKLLAPCSCRQKMISAKAGSASDSSSITSASQIEEDTNSCSNI
ncbi:SIN3-HDAC complex-associated factor [Brevipalpus obovatus]|uniref:SIN3-HDAC complex-associated factor n=1 Tax=Brevipalpus obovatus TaxID=246614 RepID=UPI003D9EE96E